MKKLILLSISLTLLACEAPRVHRPAYYAPSTLGEIGVGVASGSSMGQEGMKIMRVYPECQDRTSLGDLKDCVDEIDRKEGRLK